MCIRDSYDYVVRSQIADELIELGFESHAGDSRGLSQSHLGNLDEIETILNKFGIFEQGLAVELLELISN